MDLEFGEKYEAFREEVRSFLEKNRPKGDRVASLAVDRREPLSQWLTKQIEAGYWARTIPTEYGGFGAAPDLLETVIMDEEFNRAGVPRGFPAQGPAMLVPTLLEFGTEEQKKAWVGKTMRGEVIWCQGYSEPGAGSVRSDGEPCGERRRVEEVVLQERHQAVPRAGPIDGARAEGGQRERAAGRQLPQEEDPEVVARAQLSREHPDGGLEL